MATIAFDTYKAVTLLQERGFTKQQAEALIQVAQEADLSSLATKEYVAEKISQQTWQLVFFMAAQAGLIVALVQFLK